MVLVEEGVRGVSLRSRLYGLAVLLSALALVLMVLLEPIMEHSIFLLFVAAVTLSALYGGLGPGLVAALLSALVTAFVFIPPRYSLLVGLEGVLRLSIFMLVGLTISSLAERRKRAENRLRVLNEDLERWVAERTAKLEQINEELRSQITAREALARQLEHKASHDHLTDLLNQASFYENLERALARARREGSKVALLFLDLDDFKLINDSLGHQSGDQVLVEVAERLKGCLRAADTAARIGGDEFVVLMEDVADVSAAVRVTERFLTQLRVPLELQGQRLSATASIGIAVGAEEQPEELLRAADQAMYQAKSTGKARSVVFGSTH